MGWVWTKPSSLALRPHLTCAGENSDMLSEKNFTTISSLALSHWRRSFYPSPTRELEHSSPAHSWPAHAGMYLQWL